MNASKLDDVLDQLVAEYSDRVSAGGDARTDDLVLRVPAEHRPALERCLRMIQKGLVHAPRASSALAPGLRLGNYRLVRELGRGGMSIVWLAEQLDLRRLVALKLLRPGLAVEPKHVERFQREALAVARLNHPSIVRVYAVGDDSGWHWIAMEWIEGLNLAQVFSALQTAEPDPRAWSVGHLVRAAGIGANHLHAATYAAALAELLAPVARAVGVAHEVGIIHRDLKPSNILVAKDGRTLVADFGLAKGEGDPGLSLTGEPIGTPYYMSPEQAALVGHVIDARTDVYSLGVTFYEGLTGERPFEGRSVLEVLDAIRTGQPRQISAIVRGLPRDFEAVVECAMARDPRERHPSALDLATDLSALAEDRITQAASRGGTDFQRFLRACREARHGRSVEFKSRGEFLGLPLFHLHLGPRPPARVERDAGDPDSLVIGLSIGRKPATASADQTDQTVQRSARRSHGRFFGIPWTRFHAGPRRTRPMRVARGWIALGDYALGGLAVGPVSTGLVAIGSIATGGLCLGGVGIGLVTFSGFAAGLIALGGFAAGWVAIGGFALGHYAYGGHAIGTYVLSGATRSPEAIEFFGAFAPWLTRLVQGGAGG